MSKSRNRAATDREPVDCPKDMPFDFFTALEEEDREAVSYEFSSCGNYRASLIKYLQKLVDKSAAEAEKVQAYENMGAAWAQYQADQIGYRKALRRVIKTLGGNETVEKNRR